MGFPGALSPLKIFLLILTVRILSVFLVQTWYVPDEYWQSLEVAHKHVFGYGALTWEWSKGIRSYFYPAVIAAVYKALELLSLDFPDVLVYLPRLLQATLSAVADYSFYKWAGRRKWALFLILSSWFWFYTSGRTLINTFETALVTIALSLFPFKTSKFSYEPENSSWVWLACLCFHSRPTSVAIWAVLFITQVLTTSQPKLRLIFRTFFPIAFISLWTLTAIDSFFYGSVVFTPWEFFKLNVLNNIGSFYGTHSWSWYLTQGLPAVLGVLTPFVLLAIYSILRGPKEHKNETILLGAAALHLIIHSVIPHKEFRFLLPILPILLYITQDFLVRWSRKAVKWQIYTVAGLILVGNAVPAVYFGQVHQRATTQVMPLLREATSNRSSILFMTPCHSTPLYSHLHKNVTTRFLSCEPPLESIGEADESERFFLNPTRWWKAEYSSRQLPSHIVLFDKLRPRVSGLLQGYNLLHELPHTQLSEGEVSENLLVFEKIQETKTSATEKPPVDPIV